MQKFKLKYILFIFGLSYISFAQNTHLENLKTLDKLLSDKKTTEAQSVLKQNITDLKSKKSYYLLTDYIYYTGKISLELNNLEAATHSVNTFVKSITTATDSIKVLRQVKLELATYYALIGDSQKAYEANLDALNLTSKWDKTTPEDYGLIENNLGTLANRKGDLVLGLKHHRKALKYYESYPKTNKTNFYVMYNSLGGSMWYVSKIDSALYYYQKAEKTLKLMEANPMNSYYRVASLNNNIAGIYTSQGNLEKALEAMNKTISYLNQFLKAEASDTKKESAQEFLFMAIENYAGIYKNIGDFEKAKELIQYAYKEKQKHFHADSPELYKAKILLGQIYLSLKNHKLSKYYLDAGIAHIKEIDNLNSYWFADAHFSKAILSEELGEHNAAKHYYKEAERLYENSLHGAYDELYLDFTTKASLFYATHQEKEKALAMSKKAYEYVLNNQGSTTSFEIRQSLNLGEIYYELGDYSAALSQAYATEELLKKRLPTETHTSDSIKIILYKPQTILLKIQSAYKLQNNKDVSFLKKQFHSLKDAIKILESQKILIDDDKNLSILIDKNSKIFEFAKQLAFDLYENTKELNYLNEALSLHESIIYNRIRARLNSKTSITYTKLPKHVLDQEKTIKKELKNALNETDNINLFINANKKWNSHLEMLKHTYPDYYKLRFASISKSLKDIEQKLPTNTTAIRYIYTNEQLYAIILTKNSTKLFKLNQTGIKNQILKLIDEKSSFEYNYTILNNLYTTLWKPFENDIKTNNVIIIPDRDLFNLNFEMLTTKIITSNKELVSSSLLKKHVISYNYSLFLIGNTSKIIGYNNNFVAFVPEFNDKMKSDYKVSIQDSLFLDKTYLTLLPQPFSKDLAKYSTKLFSGSSFLNDRASKQMFTNKAKEHKIIHIGTHAESNNISPELSRLVFAKSLDSINNDDNYLYTYEIYNTNLSSNLAILTACETGKPTYQAGEGMISLAHAFNYAGSESILTSLWKIDEQSSAKIVEFFYKYIKKGWTKDKALQQAKLDYIATAEERTAHPQYWAGLVLIGNTSSIEMQSTFYTIIWTLGILIFILIFFGFVKHKTKSP